MDRYPSFDAYAAAKYRIFRNQQAGDTAIVNANEQRDVTRKHGVGVAFFRCAACRRRARVSTATEW